MKRSVCGRLAVAAGTALFLVPLLPAAPLAAQSLYMPRNVKAAIKNGTRTIRGLPGAAYWENHARYVINVTALPPARTIRGSEAITYHNNSPDTLRSLNFKLFLDIHTPAVQVDSFSVGGVAQPWPQRARIPTNRQVRLPAPLLPHDSVQMTVAWHYEISEEPGREGMQDSTTWYVAYFYPRVAVYDDYNGWDTMQFTGQQEFYSDFNDYDVTFHVPANFVVWGTGTLQDPASLLQPGALQRYQASFTSDTTIHVATAAEVAAKGVTAQQPMNAWRFTATNVPDMAFGLSDHYDWDAGSVVVDTLTGRRASVQAAFHDSAADFHHMVRFGRNALGWFSRNWPGVPYPYEKSTVFQGSADMEYPMMVNDGSTPDTSFSKLVVEHEMAHTYMPFYMGINESRYAFMDEGWATTFEYLIGLHDVGAARAGEFYRQFRVTRWINDPSPLEDLPIITPADVLKGVAYGNNAYGKASLGYLAMKDLLGDALFKKCLQAYMARWNGKHPSPWDFFYTFDNVSKQDLDWFWTNWYFSNNYIDLAVTGARRKGAGYAVSLTNIGGMAAPVDLKLTWADGSTTTQHATPAIWRRDQHRAVVTVPGRKALRSVTLDGGIWMDADTTNNVWKR